MAERHDSPRVAPEAVGQDPAEPERQARAGRGFIGYVATATGVFWSVGLLFLIMLVIMIVIIA